MDLLTNSNLLISLYVREHLPPYDLSCVSLIFYNDLKHSTHAEVSAGVKSYFVNRGTYRVML